MNGKRLLAMLLAMLLALACFGACAEGGAVTVACVGDSLTYGVIPGTPGKQTEANYPAALAELLGEGFEVQNYGKPGSSLTENGVAYKNRDGYEASLAAAAQVYIIMLGTNDANADNAWDAALFEGDLGAMVDAYRAASPEALICLMAPPEVFPNEEGVTQMNEELLRGELREIVKRVAEEKGARYIDLFAATEGHPEWIGGDGIHFLDEGYAQIAQAVFDGVGAEIQALK